MSLPLPEGQGQGVNEPLPYYLETGNHEGVIFEHAYRKRLPVMLKGPTGCGKTRFVEAMAARLGRPLVTVSCHDDTSATDLIGRYLVRGADTVWQDGPVTRAARQGAILYLDEVAEAREDVIVVLHSLSDHRRQLFVDRHDETLVAHSAFQLVASFNPGYQRGFKELKPSTRQRFVFLSFNYPPSDIETEIVAHESGVDVKIAKRLVSLAVKIRALEDTGAVDTVSTRSLVAAGMLISEGLEARSAFKAAVIEPLSDESTLSAALGDLVDLTL
ncbi:MAG: CbbQ/NirQ/NorQ/GpvN family protein [Myxococcales bacterium]|nr:CbbQ/NirQ/NorQ/GpvN family protein [Myxococcales bacterium]